MICFHLRRIPIHPADHKKETIFRLFLFETCIPWSEAGETSSASSGRKHTHKQRLHKKFPLRSSSDEARVSVAQACLCDRVDCRPPGCSVHGDSPGKSAGVVAMPFSRGSCRPKDGIRVSTLQAASLPSEPPGKPTVVWGEDNALG